TLVPPFYARETPKVGGWPFFYWWQFAWIVVTAIIVAVVYRLTTERVPVGERGARRGGGTHVEKGAKR
ncbi:MAG: DUF3311 domain-containing protein, partial [Acidimicrobiales bacterium]